MFTYIYDDSTRKTRVGRIDLLNSAYVINTFDSVARRASTKLPYDVAPGSPAVFDAHGYTYNQTGQRTKQTRDWGLNWIDDTYDSVGQLNTALAKDNAGSLETRPFIYPAKGAPTPPSPLPGEDLGTGICFMAPKRLIWETPGLYTSACLPCFSNFCWPCWRVC